MLPRRTSGPSHHRHRSRGLPASRPVPCRSVRTKSPDQAVARTYNLAGCKLRFMGRQSWVVPLASPTCGLVNGGNHGSVPVHRHAPLDRAKPLCCKANRLQSNITPVSQRSRLAAPTVWYLDQVLSRRGWPARNFSQHWSSARIRCLWWVSVPLVQIASAEACHNAGGGTGDE